MDFLVGTLTRVGGEGLLFCRLTGNDMQVLDVFRDTVDPNWVLYSPASRRIFATGSDWRDGGPVGTVSEYALEQSRLRLLSRQATQGAGPCYLALDAQEKHLYCANYGDGSLAVFDTENGLSPIRQQLRHTGAGPHPIRQAGPHIHQALPVPGTDCWAVCDLGTDEIVTYQADAETGMLKKAAATRLHGGPRHLVFSQSGMAYLSHELSSEVSALRFSVDGTFHPLQTLSTLPEGFDKVNTASAIRMDEANRRLYCSNRGHGSLAVYSIGSDGLLTFERHMACGEFPRDFRLLPGGRILIADQHFGLRLLAEDGAPLSSLPMMGAVSIALI